MAEKVTKIINGRVVGSDIAPRDVYFRGGRIVKAGSTVMVDNIIDAGGCFVAPGFIDIHCHGGGDADFMDGTPEAFLAAARMHGIHGTTTLFPTATSGSFEEMSGLFAAYEEALKLNLDGADFAGIHLEGPYFAMSQKGAQDPKYVRPPEPSEYRKLLALSDKNVRWSAAPELEGALDFARELRERGILAASGHTDCLCEEAIAAFEAGFTHVTHLYSAMSSVHRRGVFRHAGLVEAAYLLDDMTVEIIADGIHLPPPLLKLIYKLKGPDRIALITDAMRGAGMPEGESVIGSRKNGLPVIIEDGVAKLTDKTAFAGSVATTDRLVRNMVQLAEVPLTDAVKMATATPAAIMKLSDRGTLDAGKRADIVIFDDNITMKRVIVGGRTIFEA